MDEPERTYYKIWVQIERTEIYDDGEDFCANVNEPESVGMDEEFQTQEQAQGVMDAMLDHGRGLALACRMKNVLEACSLREDIMNDELGELIRDTLEEARRSLDHDDE